MISQELVTDESVYSRNRYFRLLFHAKFGKRAVLMLPRESVQQAFGTSPCSSPNIPPRPRTQRPESHRSDDGWRVFGDGGNMSVACSLLASTTNARLPEPAYCKVTALRASAPSSTLPPKSTWPVSRSKLQARSQPNPCVPNCSNSQERILSHGSRREPVATSRAR